MHLVATALRMIERQTYGPPLLLHQNHYHLHITNWLVITRPTKLACHFQCLLFTWCYHYKRSYSSLIFLLLHSFNYYCPRFLLDKSTLPWLRKILAYSSFLQNLIFPTDENLQQTPIVNDESRFKPHYLYFWRKKNDDGDELLWMKRTL